MSRPAWVALVLLGLAATPPSSAGTPIAHQGAAAVQQAPADARQALPSKAELRKDVELTPVQMPGFQPSQVPPAERVPFYCVVDRGKPTSETPVPPVEVWLSIRSAQPVKAENLHVHVQVPLVEAWTFKVATPNHSLYPRWTWIYHPAGTLLANYNLPGPGQPLLRCDAFGWYPKQ